MIYLEESEVLNCIIINQARVTGSRHAINSTIASISYLLTYILDKFAGY